MSLVGGTDLAHPRALCIADTSGDGKDDLVVGWASSASASRVTYAIYNGVLTSGTATASPITITDAAAAGAPVRIACGNFRGSAAADLVLTRPDVGAFDGPFVAGVRDLATPSLPLYGQGAWVRGWMGTVLETCSLLPVLWLSCSWVLLTR